jgi:hypothetical protein
MKYCVYLAYLSMISFSAVALPKISIEHQRNALDIPRVKVTNETTLTLACYVAIDGFKKRFVLTPFNSSRWYSASSKRYNHTHFKTWCDSIEFYPHYKKHIK